MAPLESPDQRLQSFPGRSKNVSMSMRHGVLFARILLDVRFSLVRAFPLSHRLSSCIWVRTWNTFLICVSMRNAVKDAANCFPSAIISGRSREKVYEFIGLQELYYVGSHGMDLAFPFKSGFDCLTDDQMGNNVSLYQPASEFLPMIDEVFNSLIEKTKDIHGSKIENNKFCVSVHYRLVDKNNWAVIAQCVHDILKDYPHFELTYGRKVLEIRPTIRWNKGTAVEYLLESLNLNDSQAVLPIYIGDDRSDEDAFKVLRERNSGYGILVSSIPKETNAHFSLKDPSEVLVFLKSLVIWKQSQEVLQRST